MSIFSAFTEGLTPLRTAAGWRAALGLGSGVPVPVAEGGTGATDAATARTNLGVPLATQGDQEAETAGKVVTSDVQHFGPSAAKCWAYVTVSAGTPTLAASYNITSITDSGVGDLTITIATDFSSANWCALAMNAVASGTSTQHVYANTGQTAGAIELFNVNATPAAADPGAWYFVGYGDQ